MYIYIHIEREREREREGRTHKLEIGNGMARALKVFSRNIRILQGSHSLETFCLLPYYS